MSNLLPKNEKGIVLVTGLIFMAIIAIVGTTAVILTTTDSKIGRNYRANAQAFYAAEAGIDHARAMLKSLFVQRNATKIAAGQDPDWDFALNGTAGFPAATGTDYDNGVTVLTRTIGGNYTYDVKVWDNSDGGAPPPAPPPHPYEVDTDSLIYARSVASEVGGATSSSIEVLLQGSVSGGTTGYNAQAGAGPGKSHRADDLSDITDFTQQF